MQYHTVSLAATGFSVDLVGYRGEPCVQHIVDSERITEHRISPAPCRCCPRKMFLLYAPLKVIFQILQLLWVLVFVLPRYDALLVQNPPSIPTLLVAWVATRLRCSKLVIDWHNFGYTILGLTLKRAGVAGAVLGFAEWYERFFGNRAQAGLCVTHAMREWLRDEWGVNASVLHDRPPSFFRRTPVSEQHNLFKRLQDGFRPSIALLESPLPNGATLFTDADARPRVGRPALLISSTSWTPDEDFSILLDALHSLAQRALQHRAHGGQFPHVVCVVTGKGPQRSMYEERIRGMKDLAAAGISILTMWLEIGDYPLLLGSADLGVCLHTSSSGLDLPMKVVDMFGCGLPVCAVGFRCLPELVKHGENGLVFADSVQLCDQLFALFSDPDWRSSGQLQALAAGVREWKSAPEMRWQANWERNALPHFL